MGVTKTVIKAGRTSCQVVLVALMAALAAGCAASSTPSKPIPHVCVTDGTGGKVCGSAAQALCKEFRSGQTVSTDTVKDPATLIACGELGVGLNHLSPDRAVGAGYGVLFVDDWKQPEIPNVSGFLDEFQYWVTGQDKSTSKNAPPKRLSKPERHAAALVALRFAQALIQHKLLPSKVGREGTVNWLRHHGVS